MPNGVIGIPCCEDARSSQFWECLAGLHTMNFSIDVARGSSIASNRNDIIRRALAQEADYVFFLDDDHVFPRDILRNLLAHGLEIVGAHYVKRLAPHLPLIFGEPLPSGAVQPVLTALGRGLIPVSATGAGCLLVKTNVFRAMTDPWFTLGHYQEDQWGDDIHFFEKTRKAGYQAFVDLDAPIGHITQCVIWPKWIDNEWRQVLVDNKYLIQLPPVRFEKSECQ